MVFVRKPFAQRTTLLSATRVLWDLLTSLLIGYLMIVETFLMGFSVGEEEMSGQVEVLDTLVNAFFLVLGGEGGPLGLCDEGSSA